MQRLSQFFRPVVNLGHKLGAVLTPPITQVGSKVRSIYSHPLRRFHFGQFTPIRKRWYLMSTTGKFGPKMRIKEG